MADKQIIKILLVDDEAEVLNTWGDMIDRLGWKCFRAPTGEIGLDMFKMYNIDSVILDLNLPKMDGFEVLKAMKQLKPGVPVVILTGLGYEKDRVDKAVALGASGYVGKAMPVKDVISKIKAVLGKK
ncbi:MAG: response regulator [Candidatus Omnitrophica bacterium]|nr:response regulator [Candidatus Omnitrophota bacterium]